MGLDQIVQVTITRETRVPTQKGFGTPLILGSSDRFAASERVRTYTSIAQVEADFTAGDPEIQAASDMFGQVVKPTEIKIGQQEAGDADAVAALTAIEAIDDDWYGLFTTSRVKATIEAVAAWVQSRTKIYLPTTSDADAKNGVASNVAENLNTAAYDRTALWFSDDADNDLSAAVLGLLLPRDPGSVNWAHQTLSGPDFDALTETQRSNLLNENANIYIRVAGLNDTQFGTMASGEFIDVIRGQDFIKARMQELVFAQLINSDKIPYTNDGIAVIESKMREALSLAVGNQIITPDFEIFTPDVSEISSADKGTRCLPDMEFVATLAGAINVVKISGKLVL